MRWAGHGWSVGRPVIQSVMDPVDTLFCLKYAEYLHGIHATLVLDPFLFLFFFFSLARE